MLNVSYVYPLFEERRRVPLPRIPRSASILKKNDLPGPNSQIIIVVRRDQIFQSNGPGTYPRGSRKTLPRGDIRGHHLRRRRFPRPDQRLSSWAGGSEDESLEVREGVRGAAEDRPAAQGGAHPAARLPRLLETDAARERDRCEQGESGSAAASLQRERWP